MKKSVIIALVSFLVIGAGAFVLLSGKNDSNSSSNSESTKTATTTPSTSTPTTSNTESYSAADVSTHNKAADCWTIVNNEVYNITSYVPRHPGGVSEITKICGTDGTALFEGNREHTGEAKSQLAKLKIGSLK